MWYRSLWAAMSSLLKALGSDEQRGVDLLTFISEEARAPHAEWRPVFPLLASEYGGYRSLPWSRLVDGLSMELRYDGVGCCFLAYKLLQGVVKTKD